MHDFFMLKGVISHIVYKAPFHRSESMREIFGGYTLQLDGLMSNYKILHPSISKLFRPHISFESLCLRLHFAAIRLLF